MNAIRRELDGYLRALARPVRVDLTLKGDMVLPVTRFEPRERKEKAASDAFIAFREAMKTASLDALPLTIVTPEIDFTLMPTVSSKRGYCGIIGSNGAFGIPEDEIIEKLQSDVKLKAKKRDSWKGEKKRRPYIIALVDEISWTDRGTVTGAFVGNVTYAPDADFSKVAVNQTVASVRAKGWQRYMREEGFLPDEKTRCYLPVGQERGFVVDKEMANVSAVLVLVQWTGRYYFLPNPFAAKEICAPWIVNFIIPRFKDFL